MCINSIAVRNSRFIVSYNNSFRILRGLPMRCSASGICLQHLELIAVRQEFVVVSLACVAGLVFPASVMNSDVYVTSELHERWITALYTIAR